MSRNAQTLRATELNDPNLEVRAVRDGSLNLVGWTWTKMAGAVFLISIHVHMFWDGLIKVIKNDAAYTNGKAGRIMPLMQLLLVCLCLHIYSSIYIYIYMSVCVCLLSIYIYIFVCIYIYVYMYSLYTCELF